jgi:endonuclease/exonuclease/phosphatase family metal-dependent hydrolase
VPTKLRLATFNVENLFSRAKVLNYKNQSTGDQKLAAIEVLRSILKKDTYSPQDKTDIYRMVKRELQNFITIRENRHKLLGKSRVVAAGAGDWDGEIVFREAKFSEVQRENTARVIKEVAAHVLCIVEAESLPVLRSFDTDLLGSRYPYDLLIDSFDPRGIDVGLYSKFAFGTVRTHMFDKSGSSRTFSRDCLEVDVLLPGSRTLHMLCNHFKSKANDKGGTADARRRQQAEAVRDILAANYDLTKDLVVVAGDFNDNPTSGPLQPLLAMTNLHDVLELQFPGEPAKRWTYYYKQVEQIDFLLVSEPLKDAFRKAGVERRGIYDLERITSKAKGGVGVEKQYPTVGHYADCASDHGAVWAEFALP